MKTNKFAAHYDLLMQAAITIAIGLAILAVAPAQAASSDEVIPKWLVVTDGALPPSAGAVAASPGHGAGGPSGGPSGGPGGGPGGGSGGGNGGGGNGH